MSTAQQTFQAKDMLKPSLARRLLITAGIVLLALGLAWYFFNGWDWEAFLAWKRQVGVVPFFAGLAVLPLIGVPTTPLFIIAGATFGLTTALAGTAIAIAINQALSYWLARHVLKQVLIGLLQRWGYELPAFTPGKALSFLILMRLAPGLPAFLKNYTTALFDIPFGIYLAVSWMITFAYALSFIVLGDSLYNGDLREGAVALLMLLAVVAGFAWINKRQQRILDEGGEDKISALRDTMAQPAPTLSLQALTPRVLNMIVVLTLLWAILAENNGWVFASEVIIAAVLASMFFATLLPTRYSISGLLLFACYFIVEALRGGLDVAWRAFHPRLPIAPGWLDYTLTIPQGTPQVLFLNSVSLLPGTLSVTLKGNVVVVHSLVTSATARAELARLEYWVMRVFVAPRRETDERVV